MNINLNPLMTFFLCGKHRTFSEAAAALFLTTPAVTMQMKQLEAHLGIDLFHRHRKTIELTEPGLILFEHAKKIFELAKSVENTVKAIKDLNIGDLRIGTLQTYSGYMMSALITSYQEKYPGIHVLWDEGSSTEIICSIIDRKNELGLISVKTPIHPQLQVIPYFLDELVLVLPSDHPLCKMRKICMEDLAHEPLVIRQKGSISREIILDKYREAKIEPHIVTEAKNVAFNIEQVVAAKGISFMPTWSLQDQLQRGAVKVRSLAEGPFLINIDIAYLKNRVLSPAAQAFMNLLMERKNARASNKLASHSDTR